ncbi:MAG TPA: hypothetical protein VHO04_10370 [Sphingopyxis sp.]|jgi:hypothetical protein|nr:hypothetical protein [Sphingopyxis sp.]HEX2813077.1 hypothetical protein [Sphingopyxis sp.]
MALFVDALALSRSVSPPNPVLLETQRDYTDIAAMAGIVWPVMEI